jgi:alpha-amylase/alpha-mannosidase (GH57 family)
MRSIIIHGHFYQPPRENPWTGAIDREDSARPYHDWNERIHRECYRANAFARIFDSRGRVDRIANNYANISFNFGPTLLGWVEREHPRTYGRILAADKASAARLRGHGNAIAQGYNHTILPLCNVRDRRTQVLWGIADFRHRFGRAPESLWLPETACNDDTLGTVIDCGLSYVILSPFQAQRVRPIGKEEWHQVDDGSIDPRKPYRYFHRDRSGRSLAIFFYDGNTARAIAFEGALTSSQVLLERLTLAFGRDGSMVNVATDGETYGHHFHFGDRSLAYALEVEAAQRSSQVTNYAEYLENHQPSDEVEIKPGPNGEGTAWSCSHGVGRWYRDCGCSTGAQEGWNQAWRGPLRAAFDYLRDFGAKRFEEIGGELFRDPWLARDEYISVILKDGQNREDFLRRHARRQLDEDQRVRALTLMEMQRDAMLMYTSCGWFFADISGLETVQVMKYSLRVIDFLAELGGEVPRDRFLEILAQAKSSIPEMGNGADVFRRFVEPSRVSPRRIAAHLAISSLVNYGPDDGEIGDYVFHKKDFREQEQGRLKLATGRTLLEIKTTGKRSDFAAAALHLGGIDFYCALTPYPGDESFKQSTEKLWENFRTASLPTILRLVQAEFGPDEYALNDILPDGRQAISATIFGGVLEDFTAQFVRLYQENRRVVEMLEQGGFELPPALRQVTELALAKLFEEEVARQRGSRDPEAYRHAVEIAEEVERHHYQIDKSAANLTFTEMISDAVRHAVGETSEETIKAAIDLIELSKRLHLSPSFDKAQEAIYEALERHHPASARLIPLGVALGLSEAALNRLRDSVQPQPATPTQTAPGTPQTPSAPRPAAA